MRARRGGVAQSRGVSLALSLLSMLLVLVPGRHARAQQCSCGDESTPPVEVTGDDAYFGYLCRSYPADVVNAFMAMFWYDNKMSPEYWDDGFGYEDPCNIDQPLARLFNAELLLLWDLPSWYAYSRSRIGGTEQGLRAGCYYECDPAKYGGVYAMSFWGGDEDRVELFMPFFYFGADVSFRAAGLVHEARHFDPPFIGHEDCPKGTAGCDQRYEDRGSYAFEVDVHWDYAMKGAGPPRALREASRDYANALLGSAFVETPTWRIAPIPTDSCPPGQINGRDGSCQACTGNTIADLLQNSCRDCGLRGLAANYNNTSCVVPCDSPYGTLAVCAGGLVSQLDTAD